MDFTGRWACPDGYHLYSGGGAATGDGDDGSSHPEYQYGAHSCSGNGSNTDDCERAAFAGAAHCCSADVGVPLWRRPRGGRCACCGDRACDGYDCVDDTGDAGDRDRDRGREPNDADADADAEGALWGWLERETGRAGARGHSDGVRYWA